jgi:hypothetical protein
MEEARHLVVPDNLILSILLFFPARITAIKMHTNFILIDNNNSLLIINIKILKRIIGVFE